MKNNLAIVLLAFFALPATVPGQDDAALNDALQAFIQDHQAWIHPAGTPGRFTAVDAGQGLVARIDGHGFDLTTGHLTDPWSTRFQIAGIGRGHGTWSPWEPNTCQGHERELLWPGEHMDVQYVNSDNGLRQNFLVHRRPDGSGPFRIALNYAGPHCAELSSSTAVVFKDSSGTHMHGYEDLHVFDACGRTLAAWMEVDPGMATIMLHVDDRHAEYPITVDPINTNFDVQITLNNVGLGIGTPGTFFGYGLSSAGDLNGDGYGDIAIGAYEANLGEQSEGAVYVFYGGPNGITPAVNTVLQSDRVNARFGISVAHGGDVNGDGYSDLIVGSHTYNNGHANEGAVWVFFGSPTGVSQTDFHRYEPNRANTYLGFDVAGIGDINGDGYSDFVAGCSLYSNGPNQGNEGAAYVFLGSATGLNMAINPAHILEPNWAAARFGSSVSSAGDINGDGYDDLVVGAFGYDLTCATCADGAIMVYYGSPMVVAGQPRPFGTTPTAVNPAPGQLFNAHEETDNNRTGWSVAGAGDVNGDGYSDVIVGDFLDSQGLTQEGGFMVFHGTAGGLSTSPSTVVYSGQFGAAMGWSVSSAGDMNGDGYADVLVGVVNRTPSNPALRPGAVELYLGGPGGIDPNYLIRFTAPNTQNNARFGQKVACAGDVNGDGFSDILLALPNLSTDPTNAPGNGSDARVRIVYGQGYGLTLNSLAQTAPPRIDVPTAANGHAGWSVANAGDVNGDGLSDVVVGVPDTDAGVGQALLYHGTPNGPSATPALVITGTVPGGRFGASVATAGDVNGDGYADVVIGAPGNAGQASIHLGGPGGLNSEPAIVLTGTNGSGFGAAVSTAGDVNCDAFADVIIAAPGAGLVHIHHGAIVGRSSTPAMPITSTDAGCGLGSCVATAGDVNGDGYSDIIIGAPLFSNGEPGEGGAFVYVGTPDGIDPAAHRQLEGNEAGIRFGISVAGVGDVNGNGISDVAVGADLFDPNGAIRVFHGSLAGLSTTPNYSYNLPAGSGNAARLGYVVAEGGDIDGNGLADIIVGAPGAYSAAGQINEGRIYVFLMAAAGAPNISNAESNVANRQLGWSVAGGGDVDGDGFSDIIAGAPYTTGGDGTQTGAVYFYPGNATKGLSRPARQYQADLVSPLSTNSEDFMNTDYFGVGFLARSHMQRKPGRLHWEVVHEGEPFSGAPNIGRSVASDGSTPFQDLGLGGVEIKQLIYKEVGYIRYKWRVRAEYDLNRSGQDGQRFGKWHYGYASAHGDIGILPVELLVLDGVPLIPGNLISWATATEHNTSHFVVERSVDHTHFEAIGTLAAAGSSTVPLTYELLDEMAPVGLSYYRLRMVDLDGSEELSSSVSVHRGAASHMQLYPNPVEGMSLHWHGTTGGHYAQVHDATGRLVIDAALPTNEEIGTLALGTLPAGHYTLLLLDTQGQALGRAPFIKR